MFDLPDAQYDALEARPDCPGVEEEESPKGAFDLFATPDLQRLILDARAELRERMFGGTY